ncbi:glycosyltransferase family 4 protein [Oceanihabitans sediminis]|uniref:glycosyltransferase family 4 protein n=1 Tax=Oceanihabitans sediminis TaxID=1812012 RepID=UPI003A902F47
MKILQVIDKLDVGGAERVAVDLSIILSKNDIDVSFLCLLQASELDKELEEHQIPLVYLNRKNKFNVCTLMKLHSILQRFDIIHVHSRHVLRYLVLTNFIPFRRYKLVFQDHFGTIENDVSVSAYTKFCMKHAKAYIGVSKKLVNWATRNKVNANIFLLPNIVRKQSGKIRVKSHHDIVVVGNFRPQKNYEFLLDLLEELPEYITVDIYGIVVDKVYYNKISHLIQSKRLDHRIHIITNCSTLAPILHNYKLALHCSASETGPLVAIEYMAAQLPFVMYKTGEVAEQIHAIDSGFLQSNFNVLDWKGKVLRLLQNKEARTKAICTLEETYTRYYSEENYINSCIKIYQQVLSS